MQRTHLIAILTVAIGASNACGMPMPNSKKPSHPSDSITIQAANNVKTPAQPSQKLHMLLCDLTTIFYDNFNITNYDLCDDGDLTIEEIVTNAIAHMADCLTTTNLSLQEYQSLLISINPLRTTTSLLPGGTKLSKLCFLYAIMQCEQHKKPQNKALYQQIVNWAHEALNP